MELKVEDRKGLRGKTVLRFNPSSFFLRALLIDKTRE